MRASVWLHALSLTALAAPVHWWPWVGAALAANHGVLALGLNPRSQIAGRTLVRLQGAPGQVALTFDDGPDPEATPAVLDLLDGAGVKASFFMIGTRAACCPALVAEVARRGHRVENHTWSHSYRFPALGVRGQSDEIGRAQVLLTALAGSPPQWARAPAGLRSPFLDPVLAHHGLAHASWTRRGYDTRNADPQRLVRRLIHGLRGGDVLMLHDGHSARTGDGGRVVVQALPGLLRAAASLGLQVTPLPPPDLAGMSAQVGCVPGSLEPDRPVPA